MTKVPTNLVIHEQERETITSALAIAAEVSNQPRFEQLRKQLVLRSKITKFRSSRRKEGPGV